MTINNILTEAKDKLVGRTVSLCMKIQLLKQK